MSSPAERVLVYEPDGVNPYGRELAALLAKSGREISLFIAADVKWAPKHISVETYRVLPANGKTTARWKKVFQLTRGIVITFWKLFAHDVVVVVWFRTAIDGFLFAVASLLGKRLVFIAHNPFHRPSHGRLYRLAVETCVRHSPIVVAHGEWIARELSKWQPRGLLVVCPCPPYTELMRHVRPMHGIRDPDRYRVLQLGNMREDKNLLGIQEIMCRIPDAMSAKIDVVYCGKGRLQSDLIEQLTGLGCRVIDLSSEDFVPDEVVIREVQLADVLLAPYTQASQSGSIALAMTVGLPVVAFDVGSIGEQVPASSLIPADDYESFARATEEVLRTPKSAATVDVKEWRARTQGCWEDLLTASANRPRS